jgi:hypothetical protein
MIALFSLLDVVVSGGFVIAGILCWLFAFSHIKLYREFSRYIKHQGLVSRAFVSTDNKEIGPRIDLIVAYEYEGQFYEKAPTLFKYPARITVALLTKIKEELDGNLVDIYIDKIRPGRYVLAKDFKTGPLDWLFTVWIPIIGGILICYLAYKIS